MIARVWRGTTRLKDADRYHEYLLATGVRDYRATPGNCGVHVLRRVHAGAAEFVIVTFWESMAAIRAFAGQEIDRAVYCPEDPVFLLTMEPHVAHYEVLPGTRCGAGDSAPGGGAGDGFSRSPVRGQLSRRRAPTGCRLGGVAGEPMKAPVWPAACPPWHGHPADARKACANTGGTPVRA